MRRLLAASTGALLLATATVTAAAQVARDTARVAPVVVTATRTALDADRVPASVSVLRGDSLRAQGIVSVADALRLVPGVAVVQAGSYGAQTSLFVRGGQSNYTKVLVDGVPVNEPGGAIDLASLTVDDVERIEVVRGPSSVVWGSDAVTGVVNVITRRAPGAGREGGVQLAARRGTYGTADLTGAFQRRAGAWRLAAGAGHHVSEGIYSLNNHYRDDDRDLALGGALWRGADLQLTSRFTDLRAHYPTDYTGAPTDPNDSRAEDRRILGAQLGQQLGQVSLQLLGTSSRTASEIASPANDANDFNGNNDYRARWLRESEELRAVVPVGGASITLGGWAEQQRQASQSTYSAVGGAPTTTTDPEARRRNDAAYLQLVSDVGPTTATAGGRIDHGRFGDFGTYRVSVAHRLPTATRLRAAVGTAFREPSFFETERSAYVVANPELRPERTTSWEVGAEQGLAADRLVLGATWFVQRFVDLVDYQPLPGFTGQYLNVARAHANGVETELRAVVTRTLGLTGSWTWLDTRVDEGGFSTSELAALARGNALLRRPKHTATLGLGWHPAGATLDLRATYVGRRDDRRFLTVDPYTEATTLAPYTKVDLSGELPFTARGASRIALTLRAENLFDAHYEPVAGYKSQGSTVLVGARVAF